ncbi:MAG: DNA-directed RNA polymerase subunit omega [Lentisphaerae bacterium GWF2_52_8]|nr:MAG: DNA-directed RNA polymerase subunit omega [Lentisphaerae bacterium GWF2_52_8]
MNNAYLEKARLQISDPRELIIVASKRSKQLALGARPMIKCRDENYLDVALCEIAEGKLTLMTTEEAEAAAAAEFSTTSE